jgi:hypothetical protein
MAVGAGHPSLGPPAGHVQRMVPTRDDRPVSQVTGDDG